MAANDKDEEVTTGGIEVIDVNGSEALDRLKESEASEWLAAPSTLVQCAKQASEILFTLTASSFEKAPLSKLYTDRFDAEQIWQQIDLQSHPILSYIRRRVRILEKSGNAEFFTGLQEHENKKISENGGTLHSDLADKQSGEDHEDETDDTSDDEEMEDAEAGLDSDSEDEDRAEEEDGAEDDDGEFTGEKNGVEDDFLRISEMEKFLDRTDAEGVYGTGGEDVPESPLILDHEEGDDGEDEDEEDYDDDGEFFEAGAGDGDEEGGNDLGFGKYEDFFGKSKKRLISKPLDGEGNRVDSSGDEISFDARRSVEGSSSGQLESKSILVENLSSHERRQEKMEKRIKQLEKASLDPKDWTLQGEVTAKKRPKNSALEVELDFEHNVRPPPVITEEVTASLEDMIRARIAEGQFDDVQRKRAAPVAAVRERVDLDESKSQKGLGEIYEAEYMQTRGLAAAPTPTSVALKEEATELFKALCVKLDALSHFHFAPKPVIEDMGIRADVPALALEEVAPLAVSEASMLAPEEIFIGEYAIKGEGELTPEERKRRRAQKKRKRRGARETQEAERLRKRIRPIGAAPVERKPTPGLKVGHSSYSKSSKVFAELDRVKGGKGKAPPGKDEKEAGKPLHASFLKL